MKLKLVHLTVLLCCMVALGLNAQTVTGTVTSSDGEPLIGVSVQEVGTSNGTISDIDGKYRLDVGSDAALKFTYTGYATQTVAVGGQSSVSVSLGENALLDEVVVTALGISREKKSLTYGATEVNGDELNRVKDANVINALSGKVAGVQINRSGSGVGGSTRVVLRGNKSTRDNQVLYVIDGVPMFNYSPAQPGDVWGQSGGSGSAGSDGGDAISNINPDDVESMTVLKGASAAALYGSQAANGVVLITTKKGKAGATRVEYSSNYTFENALTLPKLQYTYGQTSAGAVDSWGPAGNYQDNVKDFFQTGSTWINSIALSGGNEKAQTYLSYANTSSDGIIPTSELSRHNVTLRQTSSFFDDRLSVSGSLNYINQTGSNRPSSGLYYNALTGLYFFPRGLDFNDYRDNFEVFSENRNTYLQNWVADNDNQQNPYWILNRNANKDKRNRYLGTVSAKLKLTESLSLQARGNLDKAFDKYDQRSYASTQGTLADQNGRYVLRENEGTQRYGDLILSYNEYFGKVNLGANVGTSVNQSSIDTKFFDSKGAGGVLGLNFPNVFSIQNIMSGGAFNQSISRQETQAVFAALQFGYDSKFYVDVTGRNDWSSTLAFTENNSFFYPSIGLTGILSEMFDMKGIDFAKVRLSFAEVGAAVQAFDTNPIWRLSSSGSSIAQNGPAPGTSLKPEISKSIEAGADIRFLDNRVGIDLTIYKTNTTNQRFVIDAPDGQTVESYFINAGNIQNSGVELMLNVVPVRNANFNWNTAVNFTRNKNEVIELSDLIPDGRFLISAPGVNNYGMSIQEGGSFGDIIGQQFDRDASGRLMIVDGAPVPKTGSLGVIGNPTPDFMLGWSNDFYYKSFGLRLLIDGRFGGEVMSITEAMLDQMGVSQASADARNAGFVSVNGVDESGNAVTQVEAEKWFRAVGGRAGITENYMYDATNIRFRELAFSYSFPTRIVSSWKGIKGLTMSLVGRNLGFISKKAPFDPEVSMSSGTGLQGVDSFMQPATRSFGVNLSAKF